MKDFYNKLHTTFDKTDTQKRYVAQGLTPIKTIDLYAGQDFNPESFEVVAYPALFLGWDIAYDTQNAIVTLNIRLAYEQLRDISNRGTNKAEGLKFLDLVRLTDTLIKEVQADDIGQLALESEGLDLQPTVVDVYKLNYQASYNGACRFPQAKTLKGVVDTLDLTARLKTHL